MTETTGEESPTGTPGFLSLDSVETRMLGSLIEKEFTTPDLYPLSLNAVRSAANQKSSRDPVVNYDEHTTERGLDRLQEKHLVARVRAADSRVTKFKQTLTRDLTLDRSDLAVLCVLMLRGPQTVGELRGRTARMFAFSRLAEVEETLDSLRNINGHQLVTKLPRQAGRKDPRYAHLLAGDVDFPDEPPYHPSVAAPPPIDDTPSRMESLEQQVEELRGEMAELKLQFGEFKKQFE